MRLKCSSFFVFVDCFAHDRIRSVGLEQVAVVLLDLFYMLILPQLGYMLTVRVQHVPEELTMPQFDQLIGYYGWRIFAEALLVIVTFRLDMIETSEQGHLMCSALLDDGLLV